MNKITSLRILGSIKIVDRDNSIGIPVFGKPKDNSIYTAETDNSLRITGFYEYYNEDEIPIDYNLPRDKIGESYKIGDSIPIPLWVQGKCFLIGSDSPPQDIAHTPELDLNQSVVGDVLTILERAQSGSFDKELASHDIRQFKAIYGDLFTSPPSSSKYWISKFNVAARGAASLPQRAFQSVREDLRAIGLQWVRKFGKKSSPRILSSLTDARPTVFSDEETDAVWYAYLVHNIALTNWNIIDTVDPVKTVLRRFPEGLYAEHSNDRTDLSGELMDYKGISDFPEFYYKVFKECENRSNYKRALNLSIMIFGHNDLPLRIAREITQTRNESLASLMAQVDRDFREYFSERNEAPFWKDRADYLLSWNEEVIAISKILNCDLRTAKSDSIQGIGIPADLRRDLERYKQQLI
jgi:hypothetical protein